MIPITTVMIEGILMPNGEVISFGRTIGRLVVDPADLAYNTERGCPIIGYDHQEPQMALYSK